MAANHFDHYVEEQVTILTESERVVGSLFSPNGTRLSDFLNSPTQQESKFLKVKEATVYCRRSGEELSKVPFVMVARDRVVMVMSSVSPTSEEPPQAEPPASTLVREPLRRAFR